MISFVVPVLNGPGLTVSFFQNLTTYNNHYGIAYEVVFVDNGSDAATQNMLQLLGRNFPECVKVIRNEQNEGFGPANNRGAQQAKGDLLVFTQTDVVFGGDVTHQLSGCQDGSLYGARLLKHDTGWNTFSGVVIPYLEGWFLICTKTTWAHLGGFDPIYVPADFEDVDLSKRAADLGVGLTQLDLPVRHDHMGKAGWSQFTDREKVTIRNRELFRSKWGL